MVLKLCQVPVDITYKNTVVIRKCMIFENVFSH